MKNYQQKKSWFYTNIFCIYSVVFLSLFLSLKVFHSYTAFGYCIPIVGFAIYTHICMYKDYKNPLILMEDKMTITTRGQKSTIDYREIMYVEYRGIPHCFLSDSMVLHCGMSGKIYVNTSYEDYLTLWNQIIENAQKSNPRVTISPKMVKRLTNQKNKGRFSD